MKNVTWNEMGGSELLEVRAVSNEEIETVSGGFWPVIGAIAVGAIIYNHARESGKARAERDNAMGKSCSSTGQHGR